MPKVREAKQDEMPICMKIHVVDRHGNDKLKVKGSFLISDSISNSIRIHGKTKAFKQNISTLSQRTIATIFLCKIDKSSIFQVFYLSWAENFMPA